MYPQAYINKFKIYFMVALILYTLTIALLTKSLNAKTANEQTGIIYELIVDFGNDFTFIHETTKSEEHCRFRAITISIKEKVKAYCIKRKNVGVE